MTGLLPFPNMLLYYQEFCSHNMPRSVDSKNYRRQTHLNDHTHTRSRTDYYKLNNKIIKG